MIELRRMPPSIHFYDAQYIGTPAQGQLVLFDSIRFAADDVDRFRVQMCLRPDVVFAPQVVEQGDCVDLDLEKGISEYAWSRQAQARFEAPGTLHVGIGNTSALDNFIRFALYRCLSTLPNTAVPDGAHYLDLLTVCRAINLLRPDAMPFSLPNDWTEQRRREYVRRVIPRETRSESVMDMMKAMIETSPKMMAHAVAYSSPQRIATLCGLVDGQVESLSDLKPVFLCHEHLIAEQRFGVFLALGTDPQYKNIVYMIDLQADLTELLSDRGHSVLRFIRNEASQSERPILRINLNRIPFVSPLSVLDRATAMRLGIDPGAVKRNAALLEDQTDLCLALLEISGASGAHLNSDPDFQLYGAEYLPPDKGLLHRLHATAQEHWFELISSAQDARITTLGSRLISRCFPELLDEADSKIWHAHCASRLLGKADISRVAATKEYCSNIVNSTAYPPGMRAAALHWLDTTEIGNE